MPEISSAQSSYFISYCCLCCHLHASFFISYFYSLSLGSLSHFCRMVVAELLPAGLSPSLPFVPHLREENSLYFDNYTCPYKTRYELPSTSMLISSFACPWPSCLYLLMSPTLFCVFMYGFVSFTELLVIEKVISPCSSLYNSEQSHHPFYMSSMQVTMYGVSLCWNDLSSHTHTTASPWKTLLPFICLILAHPSSSHLDTATSDISWVMLKVFKKYSISRYCCCLVAKSGLTFITPWTVAYQAPRSMGFPRQEY